MTNTQNRWGKTEKNSDGKTMMSLRQNLQNELSKHVPGEMTCEVCMENNHKYKCPKCYIKYCSSQCYKNHNENKVCKQSTEHVRNSTSDSPVLLPDQRISNEEYTEETEDRIPAEKLHQLEYSVPLKEMLENPHLRNVLKDLSTCSNPAKKMEKLMQEPIFTEFVDECLDIVESDSEGE